MKMVSVVSLCVGARLRVKWILMKHWAILIEYFYLLMNGTVRIYFCIFKILKEIDSKYLKLFFRMKTIKTSLMLKQLHAMKYIQLPLILMSSKA